MLLRCRIRRHSAQGTVAQRSATAAKEINDLISVNLAKVEQGTEVATRAGEQMGRIVDAGAQR